MRTSAYAGVCRNECAYGLTGALVCERVRESVHENRQENDKNRFELWLLMVQKKLDLQYYLPHRWTSMVSGADGL